MPLWQTAVYLSI